MALTYDKIATTTLGSAQSTVTFSSISGSYTDLVLIIAGGSTSGTQAVTFQFNSDTGSNYSRTILYGNGTSAASIRDSNQTSSAIGLLSDTGQGNTIFQIMNYSNSTTYKTVLSRGNSAGDQLRAGVGLWRSTAAITSITLALQANSFTSGSTFTLYGIKAA